MIAPPDSHNPPDRTQETPVRGEGGGRADQFFEALGGVDVVDVLAALPLIDGDDPQRRGVAGGRHRGGGRGGRHRGGGRWGGGPWTPREGRTTAVPETADNHFMTIFLGAK